MISLASLLDDAIASSRSDTVDLIILNNSQAIIFTAVVYLPEHHSTIPSLFFLRAFMSCRHPHWIFVVAISLILWAGSAGAEEIINETDVESEARTSQPSPEETLLEAASSIAEQVAEIRGLELKGPINKGVQNREQLRQMLIERFHEEVPQEEFEAEAQVYKRLGLFDEDLDYRQLMLDMLTEQIAGFYDQGAKELYIMEGLPEPVQRPAMAHEIFHAVQDQHFDIGRLLEPFSSKENGDFALARMALIEGDATVVMIDFELHEQGVLPQNRARSIADIPPLAAAIIEMDSEQMSAVEQLQPSTAPDLATGSVPSLTDSVLGSAPPIVRDVLLFPYFGGMQFVLRARAGRSWSSFDAIYDKAPASTSQILHPERYFDDDFPLEVRFDAADALPDHRPVYETVLGELQTRSWLSTHFNEMDSATPSASEIAAGWDGDRLRGYEGPGGEMVVVHLSSWRSVEQAEVFARALEQTATFRHGGESSYRSGEYGESWCLRVGSEPDGERLYVERWGELVLYIEGAPSTLNDEGRELNRSVFDMRDAIWDSLQRTPFEEVLQKRLAETAEESALEPEQSDQ